MCIICRERRLAALRQSHVSCATCGHGYKNKTKEGGKCLVYGTNYETDEEIEGTKCYCWVPE
jgi:hypothetical protein